MFKKQFLLTKKDIEPFDDFTKIKIGSYFLYYHNDLEFSRSSDKNRDVLLLGSLYCYQKPEFTNQEILDELILIDDLNNFLVDISRFYGEYIIIRKCNNNIVLLNDSCAQREIYYDSNFEAFGTQPKIISTIVKQEAYLDPAANDYHSSDFFLKKRVFVSNKTHIKNINHLLANHYVNVTTKEIKRFFPVLVKQKLSLDKVAKEASEILKGFLKAISLRHNIILPVTGGYDSRLLFLASLDIESQCDYFVSKHNYMSDNHNDIVIPKKLTALYNKEFTVVEEKDTPKSEFKREYLDSIDFPRYVTISNIANKNNALLNANISEVTSCLLGYHNNIDAYDLAVLTSQEPFKFPVVQYKNWLKKTKAETKGLDYHILDLFYWEEFESNWVAKLKTEANAIDLNVLSPFNSRYLLNLLLSVDRNKRGLFNNQLYDRIVFYLSDNNQAVIDLPINPDLPTKVYRFMSKLGILKYYQSYKLKKKRKSFIKKLIQ